jgi:hypothetical protein
LTLEFDIASVLDNDLTDIESTSKLQAIIQYEPLGRYLLE